MLEVMGVSFSIVSDNESKFIHWNALNVCRGLCISDTITKQLKISK